MREQFDERFKKFNADVASHTVKVLRDDGNYRHLRCSQGSYLYQFDVITWPGYLAYTGDMGCFVFSRLLDMFEFFRGRREALIDLGYLAEKTMAADKHDGCKEYSPELFRKRVQERLNEFIEDAGDLEDAEVASLRESIEDDVLCYADDGRDRAVEAAMDFMWRGRIVFTDFYEHNLEEYTGRFWWCCYAIPWAIAQYDALKSDAAGHARSLIH